MELLLELIFELLLEGSAEIAQDKKAPKWIRYPLAGLLLLLILVVIFTLLVVGIVFLTENGTEKKLFGVLFIVIDAVLLICDIKKIRQTKQKEKEE